jgi:ATP-dependent helicase/nuclease subunit A
MVNPSSLNSKSFASSIPDNLSLESDHLSPEPDHLSLETNHLSPIPGRLSPIPDHPDNLSPIPNHVLTDPNRIHQYAADPTASVWVSASAGTGKTKVLTERVLNLLLKGVHPRKILCLTYTRAAATEMNLRLLQRLSHWASIKETELKAELATLVGNEPPTILCEKARHLFIDVLNTPGGLNIQTIHSFCQSILQKFPLEAGISPYFSIADPAMSQQLLTECLHDLFREAQEDTNLNQYVQSVSVELSLTSVEERLKELISKPVALRALQQQGWTAVRQKLYADLKITPEKDMAARIKAYFAQTPCLALLEYIPVLQQGINEDKESATILTKALASDEAFKRHFEAYRRVFLTQEGQVRSRLVSKKVHALAPQLLPLLQQEADRLATFVEQQKAYTLAVQAETWMTLGLWLYRRYELKKQQKSVLDYDDLLIKTFELFHKPGLSPFILYKLDGGIHHVLVDEAQDTSPLQWALIAALVEEFFSGQGSIHHTPTLFAVGDFKQSIYSFQGAEPQLFHHMRTQFAEKAMAAHHTWRNVEMRVSFRSTPPVLAAVDQVFAAPTVREGVADPGAENIQHVSYDPQGPGVVEVWPLVPADASADNGDDGVRQYSAQERLAEVIACQIQQWLENGAWLEAKGRPMMARDILILVQRRNSFIYAMIRALKKRGVPVAGLDRLALTEHIAVKDLLVLGQFLLLPEDDLALATLLKSPLFGFDDDQLFKVTQERQTGQSLWETLKVYAEQPTPYGDAVRHLYGWLKRVDYVSPFHLFADVLYAEGGMQKFIARMGHSVQEILEEFLALAQEYESSHESSLQKFLHWCDRSLVQIHRDFATSALDEVRILTAHGAKGLQAPVVILADTTRLPEIQEHFIWSPEGYILPNVAKKSEIQCLAELKHTIRKKMVEEYRRLLYVAMTRAEEQLYICGWEPYRTLSPECWYSLCWRGLGALAQKQSFNFSTLCHAGWKGEGLRLAQTRTPQQRPLHVVRNSVRQTVKIPDFLRKAAAYEAPLDRPKAASEGDAANWLSAFYPDDVTITNRQARGIYLHKLLEVLPVIPETEWDSFAQNLAKEFPGLAEVETLFQRVVHLLKEPHYAFLFGPCSRAEVPVIGMLDGAFFSAQIDRLVIDETRVIIVDYKSSPTVPKTVKEVPSVYIKQLGIYRHLIHNLYPEKQIETYLLWTHQPSLMRIENDLSYS